MVVESSSLLNELGVCACLHHPPCFQDDHPVGMAHRGEAVEERREGWRGGGRGGGEGRRGKCVKGGKHAVL